MEILVRSYTENGYQPIPPVRLSDDEYGRGLQCFVYACTDIFPIDVGRRVIYLARRASKPMAGWFGIGGRMAPHETKEEAAARNFKRETGLEIPQNRLKLIAVFDYRWKDRAQLPQEIGCHPLGYTFTAELTGEELTSVSLNLEETEYEKKTGLVAFDREQLVREKVHPAILDLYDHLFLSTEEPTEEVELGQLKLVLPTDARRDIYEFEFSNSAFQNFLVNDGSRPLGQHFHREKFEIFYFLSGGGMIQTARVNSEGKIIGEIRKFLVEAGSVIRIPPYHTHRFELAKNTRFVAYSSKPFDAADMIACPIE